MNPPKKQTALCIGHWMKGTGLTRVMEAIVDSLLSEFDVDLFGKGYQGPPYSPKKGFRVIASEHAAEGQNSLLALADLLDQGDYQLIVISSEIWEIAQITQLLRLHSSGTPIVAYIPLDGRLVDPGMVRLLSDLDLCVLYHNHAKNQIEQAFAALSISPPPLAVVPHGINKETLKPTADLISSNFDRKARKAIKHEVFPMLDDHEDSFIVLNANYPSFRKRIDISIQGFAQFAADKPPNIRLCLHHATQFQDKKAPYCINSLIKEYDIESRVILNPMAEHTLELNHQSAASVLDDYDLAKLYQACDVGLNTSMAEGWGLISFEHAATGAAQVLPDFHCSHNLWKNNAVALKTGKPEITPFSQLAFEKTNANEVCNALEKLYSDHQYEQSASSTCYHFVESEIPDWCQVSSQWHQLLKNSGLK